MELVRNPPEAELLHCWFGSGVGKHPLANSSKSYHDGLPQLKRSTFYDVMEKQEHRVFEDVFHAVVDKAQMIAGKTRNNYSRKDEYWYINIY
jgi:hypothetical protein